MAGSNDKKKRNRYALINRKIRKKARSIMIDWNKVNELAYTYSIKELGRGGSTQTLCDLILFLKACWAACVAYDR